MEGNKDLSIINYHGDHIAGCLCCKQLYLSLGVPGWSDWTPGESAEARCGKGVFDYSEENDFGFLASLHDEARHCKFFDGR